MAAVQRLHPRHWDGHRLLQFLTGVALLVLAFGTTAASAEPVSPAATPVTTTVEAPAVAPAAGGDRAAAPADRHSGECQHDASRVARAADGPAQAAAEAPGDVQAAGVAQQAYGSRAPPR